MKLSLRSIRQAVLAALFTVSFAVSALAMTPPTDQGRYPVGPNSEMTPGKLCEHPTAYRYPEHIAYCQRSVDTQIKNAIIAQYDHRFGYQIQRMNRGDFKIDHFIPLSIGGSNDIENLWPQHKSVYQFSDPVESIVGTLISKGQIKQADAIRYVKECKLDLSRCESIVETLKRMLGSSND